MSATRWFSLRRRLLLLVLGGVTVGWLATLVLSYADAHHEVDELFDAQLAQTAQVLLAQRIERDHDHLEEPEHAVHPYQSAIKFQVWHRDGRLLTRSWNAPDIPLTNADGFSEYEGPDGHWRFYSQWDRRHRRQVQVAENHVVRSELVAQIAWRMVLPALLGLPLLGVWVWFATRRSLKPLDAVAGQVANRVPERLQAVEPASAPEEVRPLVEALNDLFRRVERVLSNERRFTADAAHELRTPLAALGTQAQVALRAPDDAGRRHALELLSAGTTRAAHLVDQLLTLARLDPDSERRPTAQVRLDQLAQEVCADHGAEALAKDIALELDAAAVEVAGDPDLLRILLRNLVDNALRYTPAGGAVHVGVTEAAGAARLLISDSGPGIPPAERERVFERFARLASQEIEGSGLGLSIVRRIADRHGAELALDDGPGGRGLTVSVAFPRREPRA